MNKILHAAMALCFLFAMAPTTAGFAQQPTVAEEAADLFIVTYRPGPAWQAGRPMREQGLRPHGVYLRGLFNSGRLFAAGPFTASDGGVAILRAASLEEVQSVLAVDPAITSGIFVAHVEQWWPRFRTDAPIPAPQAPDPDAR